MSSEQQTTEDDLYDLKEYCEADNVGRLRMLSEAWNKNKDVRSRVFLEGQMIGITVDLDEHPEWFEHGCLCAECLSCG